MSDSLQPHGLQHARLPCPSPSSGLCSNSCPLSWWCHPTISSSVVPLSSCLQSFPASGSSPNESALYIRWPKYWSFSFNISPSNEYSGLISLTIDWFDLLAVQGTLKSLLQHHSSKVSVLQRSTFFIVLLSHPYLILENFWTLIKFSYIEFSGIFLCTQPYLYIITISFFLFEAMCRTFSFLSFFLYQPGHLIQCWLAVMLLSIFGLFQFLKGKWLIFYHNCEVRSNTQDKDTPFFLWVTKIFVCLFS